MNKDGNQRDCIHHSRCTINALLTFAGFVVLMLLCVMWCTRGYAQYLEKQFYLTCKIYNSKKNKHSVSLESIRDKLTTIIQFSKCKPGLCRIDESFILSLMKSNKKIIFDNPYHYKSIMQKLIMLKRDKAELLDRERIGGNHEIIGHQRQFVSYGKVDFYLSLIDVVNRHNDSLDCDKKNHANCIVLDAPKKGQYPDISPNRDFFALSLESWDFADAAYYIRNEDLAHVKKLFERYFNINKSFVTAEHDFIYIKRKNVSCRNNFGLYVTNYIGKYVENPFEWY